MKELAMWVALGCYLAASVGGAWAMARGRGWAAVRWLLGAGFGAQSLGLALEWWSAGVVPGVSLGGMVGLVGWAVAGAALAAERWSGVKVVLGLAAPLGAVGVLTRAGMGPVQAGEVLKSWWVGVHVVALAMGYGLLVLTFMGAVMYLLAERALRAKRLGGLVGRLPALASIERMTQRALMSGFVLLSLGLVTGAGYAQLVLGSYWRWDPKEVWGLITWGLYALMIHTRLVQGWRGRRGAWLAVAAFAALVFTFIGAGFISGYHSFKGLANLTGAAQ